MIECQKCFITKFNDEMRTKYTCKTCYNSQNRDYYERTADKQSQRSKDYYQINKESCAATKRNYTLKKYGVTPERFREMKKLQDNKCLICKSEPQFFVIDHCHTSGKVRGLLCKSCNLAIGLLKDNTQTLNNAIGYLNASK